MAKRNDERWNQNFETLKDFIKVYGRFPTPHTIHHNVRIGQWLYNQYRAYDHGLLPKDRLEALDAFNPAWRKTANARHEENKRLLVCSDWKQKVSQNDVPIDQVFSGTDLYTCLSLGIYDCRSYFQFSQANICQTVWRATVKPRERYKDIFSFEDRKHVFHAQFPNLDFSCFNIYYAVAQPVAPFFEAAEAYSKHCDFKSRDAMRDAFNDVLKTLSPREEEVIRLKFEKGFFLAEIAPHIASQAVSGSVISAERVRQIETKALFKLKHPSRFGLIHPSYPPAIQFESQSPGLNAVIARAEAKRKALQASGPLQRQHDPSIDR